LSASLTITVDNTTYSVVDDRATFYDVVIQGAVTDEIAGSFNAPGFSVETARADLQSKTTQQGLYGVAGYPNLSFPKLATTSYTVNLTLQAAGYQDYALAVTIPVNAIFPVTAPGAAMRRLPVRLQGRVVVDATGLPAAGAQVVSVDNPNPPSPPPPPPVPHTNLLRSPLYLAHAAGAQAQLVTLTTTGTAQLTLAAAAGATTVTFNTTAGLSGSAFIRFATPSQTLVEYAQAHGPGLAAGQIVLRNGLNRSYGAGAGTDVRFVTATPAGSASSLLIDADAGDGVLVTDQLFQSGTLVVDGGSPALVEYHELGAVADGNGYYGFEGVGRVQQLFLRANPATPGTPVLPWAIEFDQPINVVDLQV